MNGQLSIESAGTEAGDEPRLVRREVLDRWNYLVRVNLWPSRRLANPEAWLRNFTDDEEDVAIALLNALMIFSDEMSHRLLESGIRSLASRVTKDNLSYADRKATWMGFLLTTQFTHLVSPEDQNDETKSGYLFARKARQILNTDRVRPASAIAAEVLEGSNTAVVIVDDFAGTGAKFIEGWQRKYELEDGTKVSYADLAKSGASLFFCPAICTATAVRKIGALENAPVISAGNVLGDEMSVAHDDSDVIPSYLRNQVVDVITEATTRAGATIPALGFGDLGLTLSFTHGTPDTTLPVFYSEGEGWTPLVRRR